MSTDLLRHLATARDGVFAVDMEQCVVFWNQSAERILGYSASEALGKPCSEVLGGVSEDGAPVCGPMCTSIQLARLTEVSAPARTFLARSKDGTSKWINSAHVLLPDTGDAALLVHIFHEATDEVEPRRLVRRLQSLLSQTPQASARRGPRAPENNGKATQLSPRELDVLRLLAQGFGTGAIAERLVISTTTARNHIQRILAKLGVHSRLEAVNSATFRGII